MTIQGLIKISIVLCVVLFPGVSAAMPAPACREKGAVIDMADVIVYGEVVKVWSREIRTGIVETFVEVRVTQYVKGQGKEVLTLKLPGGSAGGSNVSVEDVPGFRVGQKGFLCLTKPSWDDYVRGNLYYPVCGRGMLDQLTE